MKDDNAGLVIGIAVMLLGVVLIGAPLLLGHPPLQSSQPSSAHLGDSQPGWTGASTIAGANLGKSGPFAAGERQNTSSILTTNNTAVKFIKDGKCADAIDLLEPLVKANPGYGTARDNLGIAYNNQALKQTDSPKLALDSLWRSYCLAPSEAKTSENIEGMLKRLHKQPRKFEDRVAMGDAQLTEGCLYGAYAEYTAAIAIHEDAKIKAKLAEIKKQAANCSDDDINGAFYVKMALLPLFKLPHSTAQSAADKVDYSAYMSRLQRSIKQKWNPSNKNTSSKTQVTFTVAQDGTISNAHVTKSSGEADVDRAGLDAIKAMGKAEPLPAGSDPTVEIQFSFDYNVFDSSKDSSKKGD